MKKIATALLAICTACASIAATNDVETSGETKKPTLLTQEGKDAKVHSDAEYKARKKVADANKTLNKADCETALNGRAEHDCKKAARANAKDEKADAKTIHEMEKTDNKQMNSK